MNDIDPLFEITESELNEKPEVVAKAAVVWDSKYLKKLIDSKTKNAKYTSIISVMEEIADENGIDIEELSNIIDSELKARIKAEAIQSGFLKKTTKSIF